MADDRAWVKAGEYSVTTLREGELTHCEHPRRVVYVDHAYGLPPKPVMKEECVTCGATRQEGSMEWEGGRKTDAKPV